LLSPFEVAQLLVNTFIWSFCMTLLYIGARGVGVAHPILAYANENHYQLMKSTKNF